MKFVKKRKGDVIVGILVIISALFYLLVASHILDLNDLNTIVSSFGPLSWIVYSILFLGLSLVGFPVQIFMVLSGIMFNFWFAFILSSILINITSIMAFFMARDCHKTLSYFRPGQRGRAMELLSKIAKKNDVFELIVIKFIIPAIPISYAAGLLEEINARDFLIATVIQNTFITFIFVGFGLSLMENPVTFIILMIVFLVSVVLMNKFAKKAFTKQ